MTNPTGKGCNGPHVLIYTNVKISIRACFALQHQSEISTFIDQFPGLIHERKIIGD